jgi:hypothetical protein
MEYENGRFDDMSSYLIGEVDFPVNAKYSKKPPTQDERNVEIVSKTASD